MKMDNLTIKNKLDCWNRLELLLSMDSKLLMHELIGMTIENSSCYSCKENRSENSCEMKQWQQFYRLFDEVLHIPSIGEVQPQYDLFADLLARGEKTRRS